jgi:hypothetical protein
MPVHRLPAHWHESEKSAVAQSPRSARRFLIAGIFPELAALIVRQRVRQPVKKRLPLDSLLQWRRLDRIAGEKCLV